MNIDGIDNKYEIVEENYVESNISIPSGYSQVTESDVKDMKSILERFNQATVDIAQNLAKEVIYEKDFYKDTELKEAIMTRPTDSGVQIGKWEIRIIVEEKSNGKEQKRYSVVHNKNNMVIAEDLVLYEAAYGIVKLLNRGKTITSSDIKEILKIEDRYNELRSEALNFKRRSINAYKQKDEKSAQIFENKFEHSKSLASMSHKQLKKLVESLR